MSDDLRQQKIAHYKRGNQFLSEQKYDDAIAAFDAALELDPDWTDCMLALATAYSNKGDNLKAIEIGTCLVELDPDDEFAHTSLSIFYMRNEQIDEAEQEQAKARMASWKKDLKTNPDAPPPADAGGMNVVQ